SVSLPIFREHGTISDDIDLIPGNLSHAFSRFLAIDFIVAATLYSHPLNLPAIWQAGLITIPKLAHRQPETLNLFQP
ncbi:MAG: hypothetical protein DRG66_01265, partial [Deltaproteobacteria bacterium]